MLRAFRLALALLTLLPLAPKEALPENFPRSTVFFPLVGCLLGLLLAFLALLPLPEGFLATLLLALLLGLTGFLRLDGLLDAADALLGAKSREERLRILKDPHLGPFAFGVGGLYLLLLWQGLALVPDPLFLLPGFARFACLPFLRRYPLLGPGMAALIRGGPLLLPSLLALPFFLLFPLPALRVEEPGLLDLLVDGGRFLGGHLGLARSGPLDPWTPIPQA